MFKWKKNKTVMHKNIKKILLGTVEYHMNVVFYILSSTFLSWSPVLQTSDSLKALQFLQVFKIRWEILNARNRRCYQKTSSCVVSRITLKASRILNFQEMAGNLLHVESVIKSVPQSLVNIIQRIQEVDDS